MKLEQEKKLLPQSSGATKGTLQARPSKQGMLPAENCNVMVASVASAMSCLRDIAGARQQVIAEAMLRA